jgi:hypothetical protein
MSRDVKVPRGPGDHAVGAEERTAVVDAQRRVEDPCLECHGTYPCLDAGSVPWVWSHFFRPVQKVRSYAVWHVENMGWRGWMIEGLRRGWGGGRGTRPGEPPPGQPSALQPGDLVEVKPIETILATLDSRRRHKGLRWMTGMRKFCGGRHRVYKRVDRIMLETNGELRRMKDTVLLEGAVCDGKEFGGCDRSCFHFWREVWLERVPEE